MKQPPPPLIIAHRGASLVAPENTLASINLAWEMGCDAVEIDVRLTSDGTIVALHDATTDRTTGTSALVAELALEDLRKLDAGAWKGGRWGGERVPTLREVFATVPDGRMLVIELKVGEEILPPLQAEIAASGLRPEQICLIAFDYALARQCKVLLGGCRVLWLSGSYAASPECEWEAVTESLIERTRLAGFDGVNVNAAFATDALLACLQRFQEAGVDLYVWTINDAATVRRLLALPVVGLTTDVPDFALALSR